MTNDCEAMADRNGPKFDVMTNTLTTFFNYTKIRSKSAGKLS